MDSLKGEKKRIFIVGASNLQLPAILTAKEMGLYVGVADMNPDAEGVPYADEFYPVSTIDEVGICKSAENFRADGITTLCTDTPMRAVAYTCEKLHLNGIDFSTAVTATDKVAMIEAFEKSGVAHPFYNVVSTNVDPDELDDILFPVITKPTDTAGGRGIMLVESKESLTEALKYSSQYGRSGNVIIEEFLRGPEVSVELMVIDGVAHVLQVTDKFKTGAPHFVEIGHSEPSGLPEDALDDIREMAKKAALAVGINNGPAHAEIIYTEKGPKMVEIGPRMGGGCITTHLVPLSTGIDMTKATIQMSLGEKPDIQPKFNKGSAIRFIIPPVGEVVSISGEEEAKSIPGVKYVDARCTIGQRLSSLENGLSRIGYVIAQADTAAEAVKICEDALDKIKISVK